MRGTRAKRLRRLAFAMYEHGSLIPPRRNNIGQRISSAVRHTYQQLKKQQAVRA